MDSRALHPYASFWLDVADKIIKVIAVILGGIWTFRNYKKSRTYEQKLEIETTGTISSREGVIFLDIEATAKNIGGTIQSIQQRGTYCEVTAIRADLTEESVHLFSVFKLHDHIEPGEPISDTLYWRIDPPNDDIVWLRLNMRILSESVEWNTSSSVRIDFQKSTSSALEKL